MSVTFSEWVHSQEFYELCQAYRWATPSRQAEVSACFEELKETIIQKEAELSAAPQVVVEPTDH